MTSKERVLATFQFKPADRIPYMDTVWGEFEKKWQQVIPQDPTVLVADYYHTDICDELCAHECFFFHDHGKISEDDEFEIWNDGWGATVRKSKNGFFSECIERKISSCHDLEKIDFDPVDNDARYDAVIKKKEYEEEKGRVAFAKVGGIYCRSQFLRGEVELLMDMVADPEGVHLLFGKVADHLTGMALQTLTRLDLWDIGLLICDDMANVNAPMFSPDMFATYMLPLYKKMIKTVKDAGCKHVFLHSDGNIGPLIDLYLEAGFDGFNPLEPRCGQDLISLREKYGKRFICLGGVCNTEILPRGNMKEIEAHVRPLIELAKDGGIVLGCASIGGDVDPHVYDKYRKLIDRYGT